VGGLKQERVPGFPPGFADAVVAWEDLAALNMLVIAPAREAGCGRRTPIARSQSSRITKTEARYLPGHGTTVDAEQRACLAVSSQGAPDSWPVAENVASTSRMPRPEPG
jgi:hypothetical protein